MNHPSEQPKEVAEASRRLRITIVQGAFLPVPPLLGGAVEKFWQRMGAEFAARGHAVTHVSRSYKGLPDEESVNGVTHRRVRGFDVPPSLIVLKALDLVYTVASMRVLPEADILISNTFWLPILLRDMTRGVVVADVQRLPKGQLRFYRGAYLRANSTIVREAIEKEVPNSKGRVLTIPNALPFDAPNMPSIEGKRPLVLYAGRVHPEKGLELLIKAAARLPSDWSVRILGPHRISEGGGGDAYLAGLRNLAKGLPVEFGGPVYDQEKLSRHYAESSVFVYPSVAETGETFGLAPLEAMAHGCVPVVSSLACFRDFVTPGENGLAFDHRDPAAVDLLGESLRLLALDTCLRQRLAWKAFDVRVSHSPGAIATQFLDHFQRIASKRSR